MVVLTKGWLHATPLRKYIMNFITIATGYVVKAILPGNSAFFIRVGMKITLAKPKQICKRLSAFHKFTSIFTRPIFKYSHISEGNSMFGETNTAIMA